MSGFTYKSYSFTEKDPIIDEIATAIKDCGVNYKWIEDNSGVSINTLYAWFYGKTKRPQAATINAVLRSLGYKLGIVELRQAELASTQLSGPIKINPPLVQDAKRSELRHVVQMAKYRKGVK